VSVTDEVQPRAALRQPSRWELPFGSIATSIASLLAALVLTGIVILVLGANPIQAYGAILSGALGNPYNTGLTLMVATPLILTGLAAAIPFSARVWNIGGEGQLYAGAIASVLVALTFTGLGAVPLTILSIACGILAGGFWGAIGGALRVFAGANEVIVTLMLNFVALTVADYVITGPWAQNISPQTRNIPKGVTLPTIWPHTAVDLGLILAVIAAGIVFVLMRRTPLGLAIRACGFNPDAARLAGFSLGSIIMTAFAIGGACAGLAGAILVIGVNRALVPDISANYGYIGIAVALIAGLRPLWILPGALLFAIITVGGNNLTASSNISTSVSLIIEAIFVIFLLAFRVIRLQEATS